MSNPFLPQIPDQPPALVPGQSALELAGTQLRWWAVLIADVIAVPICAFMLSVPAWNFAVVVIVGIAAIGIPFAVRTALRFNRAQDRERWAGYTTLYAAWPAYWQLDPKTGAVLRRPGETDVHRP